MSGIQGAWPSAVTWRRGPLSSAVAVRESTSWAGVTSTVGFISAPLAFDFVRSRRSPLNEIDWGRAGALLGEMQAEGDALLMASGVHAAQIEHRREADIRYVGQGHEIRVRLPAGALDLAPGRVPQQVGREGFRWWDGGAHVCRIRGVSRRDAPGAAP